MGIVISKLRKKESSFQQLEKLEKKISEIENYSIETQKRQKRLVGNFIVGSLGVFIVCFGVFYFFFFPETWTDRILFSWPLLCFPIVIFTVRWMLNWYYDRKLNKKSDELFSLRDKKRQTLENVMNNEPYKAALQILDRFSEKSATQSINVSSALTPIAIPNSTDKRVMARQSLTPQVRNVNYVSPYRHQAGSMGNMGTTPLRTPAQTPNTPKTATRSATTARQSGRPLPFPLIDWRERNVMERMVDYLVGDGPSSRYAMICKSCFKHNGMALQEEFEYSNFVCAYCNQMNPARKLRPTLGNLEKNGGSPGVRTKVAINEKKSDPEDSPSNPSTESESEENQTAIKGDSDHERNTVEEDIHSENESGVEEREKGIEEKKMD
uniref:Endoplasmic reticulum junction formation protein lunapark n=1 Tax=Nyssomyia neivai TaxID=330878 RepID=A0A1L8D973_9DIPT